MVMDEKKTKENYKTFGSRTKQNSFKEMPVKRY